VSSISRTTRRSARTLLALVAASLGACGRPPGPDLQRLWTLPATLVPAPLRGRDLERTLFEADFVRRLAEWRPIAGSHGDERLATPDMRINAGAEDGREFVTLQGSAGALITVVPVEPGTCYEFEGEVRARDPELQQSKPGGAALWLSETSVTRVLDSMLSWENAGRTRTHSLASAAGRQGWQKQSLCFRTGTDTHGLYVVCLLSDEPGSQSGSVDFSGLRLRRIPVERYWQSLLQGEERGGLVVSRWPWQEERRLLARLGNENRPAILLFPGERLRLRARLPAGPAHLRGAVGPWVSAMQAGESGELKFTVRTEGGEVGRVTVDVPADLEQADWSELLGEVRGRPGDEVTLELGLEGELPGLFGGLVLSAPPEEPRPPNLLLVSIDTLRADHVGAYGGRTAATPTLDRLAAEGAFFRAATAQASWTLPSHATLFTSQFPAVHGATLINRRISHDRSASLTEILAERGYATYAFTAGGFLEPPFGFDRGFDAYADLDPLRSRTSQVFEAIYDHLGPEAGLQRIERYGLAGIERCLEQHAQEPFFLFVHTYAVHDYDPPPGELPCRAAGCTSEAVRYGRFGETNLITGAADEDHLVHLYDAALSAVDLELGRLLARLDELGLRESTLVVVTSDHGEELNERGNFGHGATLYEELLHVPLLMRVPGRAPEVVERPVMLVDVAPTCLALLGLPRDPRMQGGDLFGTPLPDRSVWSEIDVPPDRIRLRSLRDPQGWKLLQTLPLAPEARSRTELYELGSDALECSDLAAREREKAAELARRLEAEVEDCERLSAGLSGVDSAELDAATLDNLRALGYVR
jgi:arylsulfatase A-like enzyme